MRGRGSGGFSGSGAFSLTASASYAQEDARGLLSGRGGDGLDVDRDLRGVLGAAKTELDVRLEVDDGPLGVLDEREVDDSFRDRAVREPKDHRGLAPHVGARARPSEQR